MTAPTSSLGRRPGETAGGGERMFGLRLEHDPRAAATARHAARPVLSAWGLDDDQLYDTLLVLSELVTNAVTHGRPPAVLHLHAAQDSPGQVQVHVSDGGPQGAPAGWAADRPADERGRGASIVAALADSTGITDRTGTLIDHWADIPAA
ncbi:ATP-binding protein [Kitasatospora sp. NPDC085895]|uniref:ATP-binding protein n=1 Tax=Kitasatospora sp. NPDC085895 TaxID=3155057 RepID=UPI00344B763F